MDLLRKSQAPVTDAAWHEIEETVTRILRAQLRGRAVVDVDGPHGLQQAAVGLGRLDVGDNPGPGAVGWGVHRVQPLLESRITFELNLWELDNVDRGAADVDLGAAEDAARTIARFEDEAIFTGFAKGGITGLMQQDEHDPVPLVLEPGPFLEAVARALLTMKDAAVEGPYALVLGTEAYRLYATHVGGYPLEKQVHNLLEGPVHYTPTLEGGLLLSQRGGDFALTLGQDLALGYENRTDRTVSLYLSESFTFRAVDPLGCVPLPPA